MIVSEPPSGSTEPRRRRLVAVGGTHGDARRVEIDVPVIERLLAVDTELEGQMTTVVS